MSTLFFLYRSCHPRSLHSFPTRRSSDLAGHFHAGIDVSTGGKTGAPVLAPGAGVIERVRARSEEHTSELQSHSDLVCRLLLEKKKKDHILHLDADRIPTRHEHSTNVLHS